MGQASHYEHLEMLDKIWFFFLMCAAKLAREQGKCPGARNRERIENHRAGNGAALGELGQEVCTKLE